MARAENRRLLLRLYEDSLTDQQISRWLDGHSGRGLQEKIKAALLIGLPQLLGEARPLPVMAERQAIAQPETEIPAPEPVSEPVAKPMVPTEPKAKPEIVDQGTTPAFVPSQQGHQVVAKKALVRIFEEEG